MPEQERQTRARITIIVPGLSAGGTEHVVNLIANHWSALGHRVTIITFESLHTIPYYSFHWDIKIERLDVPPQRSSALQSVWAVGRRIRRLRTAIQQSRPNVVLSFLTRTNVITLVASLGMSVPVVVSERNNPAVQYFGRIWRLLQSHLYPRAFGLVTMTQGALDHFPASMRRRSWVIPNAVDLPTEWVVRRQNNTLTAVGRLTRQKGFDLLISAFAQISTKHPDWKLVIWGEGDDRKALEAQRDKLGLASRVEMPGVTPRPGAWIETADVFALSSRFEGWGIVLLEAMAAGVPVVSYDCEWGPTTMVRTGENGILVPRENIKALAEALDLMLGDPQMRGEMAARALISSQSYLPGRILAEWDNVVHSVVEYDRQSSSDSWQ